MPRTSGKARPRPSLRRRPRRWPSYLALAITVPVVALSAVAGYYYVAFSRVIDQRLTVQQSRLPPRLLGRPLTIRRDQALTGRQFVDRLNDLGYAHRARVEHPGEFAAGRDAVALVPRGGNAQGRVVRVTFGTRTAAEPIGTTGVDNGKAVPGGHVLEIQLQGAAALDALTLESPLITELITAAREKRRPILLNRVPRRVVQAVLAIEDRRFYDHPGVDIIRSVGALVTNIRGDRPYLVGGSTLTQQLVKNFFLSSEKTLRRKLLEQWMALILERRLTKDQILNLYLNEVYFGHHGSFAIHGVGEAARVFFGKDVTNLTLSEAATMAGVIQSPQTHSPFRSIERARARRNVVLQAMADSGFISVDAAGRAAREPVIVASRSAEGEAPYFVDEITRMVRESHPDLLDQGAEVHTTLDLHLQRIAQETVSEGLARVDGMVSRKGRPRRAQGALIALDPRTGDVLALVGGRSYADSQFDRATAARRQPGSVFKPFVYLAAFERAASEGPSGLTAATLIADEPTSFPYEQKTYSPTNYDGHFEGSMTVRRALALSRNIPAVKVAQAAGYDRVAALWQRIGAGTPPRPYPSIALGVFEATPLEIATAYTVFANQGELQPPRWIERIALPNREPLAMVSPDRRRVAHAQTAFLVTHLLRGVLDEGTGAGARAAGFLLDAAAKSGTTDDLRDGWFVGFTPELLTVVWIGLDDNQPLGLTGTQAALPLWTAFMNRALAGHSPLSFEVPEGIIFVEIDRDTGKLATSACPRVIREAFLAGSEPVEFCDHLFH
jgi:penicillin-binding protein 1B